MLAFSFGVFYPQIKLILKNLYVKKTIIYVGGGADVALAKSPDTSNKGDFGANEAEPQESLSIEQKIRRTAESAGFDEIDKLVAIAKCESSLKPACLILNDASCVNPHNNSFDRGLFQISRKWHPEITDECSFNLECSTLATIEIQKKSGWNAWACNALIE